VIVGSVDGITSLVVVVAVAPFQIKSPAAVVPIAIAFVIAFWYVGSKIYSISEYPVDNVGTGYVIGSICGRDE
jgi:hypothetical protein